MTQRNGPGMFKVEPYYEFNRIPVDLPSCMFKMASYHEQLGKKQGSTIHDIVVHANPAQPPLSLMVLYEMLKLHFSCRSEVHIHSSVKSLPDQLLTCLGNGVELARGEAQISLTLIWKDVSHGPVLMVAVPSQSPIYGEANVARYVARLLNPSYDTMDIVSATSVDNWLDLATNMFLKGNSKEKSASMRSLNSRLGKCDWLVGSSVSIADAVCWSAVQSAGQAASAPANVQKWLKACATHDLFEMASGLLSA
ncbi:aminoacyl tRNA synthase complex-interacting multifunctional protein 2-like isoform X2 [Acanthaster planci]|uniref:Aminoacyl tRNA synthase complex-interacting multifunctional protein 2-like isoform X2 n=1 Tax=Acanthaster planci TaxID=133434 RepID=A0A8B7XHK3_ACAPL|nr:aminoacyl tRNA synthase complex-interacting multifunctional protein 2-like isoform X2 [Acanthaster planci]